MSEAWRNKARMEYLTRLKAFFWGPRNDVSTTLPQSAVDCVVVSHFSWCHCGDQRFPESHLKIAIKEIPLISGQAVAISYAVGDFDRRLHVFGHTADGLTSPIQLTFGGEWEIADLQASLIKLSEDHCALWMDQLSIVQNPLTISEQLQKIPSIYSTLTVVVLLPCAPCPCLKIGFENCRKSTDQDGEIDPTDIADACLNAMPISSYHFRVWTRREFAFAKKISIYYSSPHDGKCFRDFPHSTFRPIKLASDQYEYLGKWAKWKYMQWCKISEEQEADNPEDSAWEMLFVEFYTGMKHMQQELFTFRLKQNREEFVNSSRETMLGWLDTFLNGQQLERHDNTDEASAMFSYIGCSFFATVQKDLVLSTMPALAAYRVPPAWERMTLGQLANDGAAQYEAARKTRRVTRLPQGLFQPGHGSMRFRPSLYIDPKQARNLQDVYGSTMTENDCKTVGDSGYVMLKQCGDGVHTFSRISEAMTYRTAFGEGDTSNALEFVRKVHTGVAGGFVRSRRPPLLTWAQRVFWGNADAPKHDYQSPAHGMAMFEAMCQKESDWGDLPEADHETVVFEIMCDFVDIHPEVAREKGLGLIVKLSGQPCVGLASKLLYEKLLQSERLSLQNDKSPPEHADNPIPADDFITVLVNRPWRTGIFVYPRPWAVEAMRLAERMAGPAIAEPRKPERLPIYEVCAVWHPSDPNDPSIAAELTNTWRECTSVIW